MALVTPRAAATGGASVSEGSERHTVSGGTSEHGLHRVYRCRRCSQRKFRTSRDLATHILAKHSHVHLVQATNSSPESAPADDAKSVTLTSPLITAADMCDIDCLLAAVSKPPCGRENEQLDVHSSLTVRRPRVSALAPVHVNTVPLTHTISSSRTFEDAAVAEVFGANVRATGAIGGTWRKSMRSPRVLTKRLDRNECTGPSSHDLYIRRCRRGQIPVVAMHSEPSETLNFAQGLF